MSEEKKASWQRLRLQDHPEVVETGKDDDPVIAVLAKEHIQQQMVTEEYDFFTDLGEAVNPPRDITVLYDQDQWSTVYSTPLTTDINKLTGCKRNSDSVKVARTEAYTYWSVLLGSSPLMGGWSQYVRVPRKSADFGDSPEMQALREKNSKLYEKKLDEWIAAAEKAG